MMSRLPGKISFELLPYTNLGDVKNLYILNSITAGSLKRGQLIGRGEIFKEKFFGVVPFVNFVH